MKIEDVRSSFTVFLIASDLDKLGGLAEALNLSGYMVLQFQELTAAFSEFPSNPPHFLLFDANETKFKLSQVFQQVGNQLPESHIFLITPEQQRAKFAPWLEKGVYDLIFTPMSSPAELLRALDRAAERDYFMYLNERLTEEKSGANASAVKATGTDFAPYREFIQSLFEQGSADNAIKVFVHSSSQFLNSGCLYFKWVGNRRVLLAVEAAKLEEVQLGELGVDFNQVEEPFNNRALYEPMKVKPFTAMISELFDTRAFQSWALEVGQELQGVFVFFLQSADPELMDTIREWHGLLVKHLNALDAEKRLHSSNPRDRATNLLNRQNFQEAVQKEVARARRTSSPVSLLSLSVDGYSGLNEQIGSDEAASILKMLARILERYSRINDVIGRTGPSEFGVVLPHTDRKGAAVKAERLRKLIGKADFSKAIKSAKQISISVGVSEYPTLVRDADELIQSADEALYSVRQMGNKTCMAQAPENFSPDFVVPEKSLES